MRGITLPYGLGDTGDLFFREPQEWAVMESPMTLSVMSAVWPLAPEDLPPTPLDLDVNQHGVVAFNRGKVS